jgi:hypothetical protein
MISTANRLLFPIRVRSLTNQGQVVMTMIVAHRTAGMKGSRIQNAPPISKPRLSTCNVRRVISGGAGSFMADPVSFAALWNKHSGHLTATMIRSSRL